MLQGLWMGGAEGLFVSPGDLGHHGGAALGLGDQHGPVVYERHELGVFGAEDALARNAGRSLEDYWEEMTTEDIGAVLEMPVGTIRSRLKRGRELLEQEMERLARSPDELQSTLSRLEDWARECRERLS